MARLASWLVFLLLMAVILPSSLALVVCFYVPWIAVRAVWLMATGRAKPRWLQTPEERARLEQHGTAPSGSLPF